MKCTVKHGYSKLPYNELMLIQNNSSFFLTLDLKIA